MEKKSYYPSHKEHSCRVWNSFFSDIDSFIHLFIYRDEILVVYGAGMSRKMHTTDEAIQQLFSIGSNLHYKHVSMCNDPVLRSLWRKLKRAEAQGKLLRRRMLQYEIKQRNNDRREQLCPGRLQSFNQ